MLFYDSEGACEVDQFDREYSPASKLKSKHNLTIGAIFGEKLFPRCPVLLDERE